MHAIIKHSNIGILHYKLKNQSLLINRIRLHNLAIESIKNEQKTTSHNAFFLKVRKYAELKKTNFNFSISLNRRRLHLQIEIATWKTKLQ